MRATTDALDTVELPEIADRPRLTSLPASEPKILRKAPQEKWTSSLAPHDLRCLLAILEGRVIPQLVHGYVPSTTTPLASDASGD